MAKGASCTFITSDVLRFGAAAFITAIVVWWLFAAPGVNGTGPCRIEALADLDPECVPFVTRLLVPVSAKLLAPAFPSFVADATPVAIGFQFYGPTQQRRPKLYAAALFLVFVAIVGSIYASRWLTESEWLAVLAPIVALLLRPTFLYDFPALALTTASLAAITRGNRATYRGFMFLATLNRETALLILPVALLRRGWISEAAGVIAIRLFLASWLGDGHATAASPLAVGYLGLSVTQIMAFAVAATATVTSAFWDRDCRSAVILPGLVFLLYLRYGRVGEVRVMIEAIPAVLLAVARLSEIPRLAGDATGKVDHAYGSVP